MRTWGTVLAMLVGLGAAAPAASADDTFDDLASRSPVLTAKDLEGMVWALTAACDQGDGPAIRRCKQVRDRRAAELRAGTWTVDAEPGAFAIGEWDADIHAVPLTLTGCIACVKPIGGLYIVSNKAAPSFIDDVASAAGVHQVTRPFDDEQSANRWRARAAGVRSQFIVRIAPAAGGMWEREGHKGIAVEILGFRVYEPCEGAIVAASPSAAPLPPDQAACGKIVDEPVHDTGPKIVLPEMLTPDDIKHAMKPVVTASKACYDNYGVPGRAKLIYTVSGAGAITAFEQTGDFVDTPTGRCIDKAAKSVTFPATQKKSFAFTFPINVQ
jgi:hypothetical protein